jgi:hypothetical protein
MSIRTWKFGNQDTEIWVRKRGETGNPIGKVMGSRL